MVAVALWSGWTEILAEKLFGLPPTQSPDETNVHTVLTPQCIVCQVPTCYKAQHILELVQIYVCYFKEATEIHYTGKSLWTLDYYTHVCFLNSFLIVLALLIF